jgi:DnaJ-class molecular chaperone
MGRECPACKGAGESTHNDSRGAYGPDPQMDYWVICEECGGTGKVDNDE